MADYQNSFTVTYCTNFAFKWSLNIPSVLKRVVTLPCEIFMSNYRVLYVVPWQSCWKINSPESWRIRMAASFSKKLCYRKDDRAMRPNGPIHGALKIFEESLTTPTATIPHIFMGFCCELLIHHMNVPSKFEVRRFTRFWNNRGYPKNLGSPWVRLRPLSSKIFNGLLFGLAL